MLEIMKYMFGYLLLLSVIVTIAICDDPEYVTVTEDSIDPQDTTYPEDRTDPEDSIDPEYVTVPEDSTDPQDTTDPADSVDPEGSMYPEDSMDSEDSIDSDDNTNPEDSTDPEHNMDPENNTYSGKIELVDTAAIVTRERLCPKGTKKGLAALCRLIFDFDSEESDAMEKK
ncbi:uncharacterized protein LOC105662279 isoform X1 [Megachile rotundata]|uniref:uncharacterized protein LOC105662279 isoform X1 n=1 Tax=Megachile rotundata TaxID=143995 RepID=UPI0006153A22|nr:PREDICTED: uncharacterized protein LOC105662279 [Megachile rotundata]